MRRKLRKFSRQTEKDSVTAVFFRLIRRLKIVMRYMQR